MLSQAPIQKQKVQNKKRNKHALPTQTAWLAKKNPRGHNNSRGTHRLVSSPIRSTHRSRHDYDAM